MKKKCLIALGAIILNGYAGAQTCTITQRPVSNLVVSGAFHHTMKDLYADRTWNYVNDIVMLSGSWGPAVYNSNLTNMPDDNADGFYINMVRNSTQGEQSIAFGNTKYPTKIKAIKGMVSGDFDGDVKEGEFALILEETPGTLKIDVYKTDGGNAFTKSNYITLTGYSATSAAGRIVAGDFDRDGYNDDIAMFYDYGQGQTRIHVFKGKGSYFEYQGASGFWATSGYTAGQITNRVVSGDFNGDGYEDEIAAFYDYGGGETRIHTWKSTGSALNYASPGGWWKSTGYFASSITNRIVCADTDNDGIRDDIAAFYDYGHGQTRMHTFESTGSSFTYSGPNGRWIATGYDATKISGKIVAIRVDHDLFIGNKHYDAIAAFYDYGKAVDVFHKWAIEKNTFGKVSVVYGWSDYCQSTYKTDETELSDQIVEPNDRLTTSVYPNPFQDKITLNIGNEVQGIATVQVMNSMGQVIETQTVNSNQFSVEFNLENYSSGIYFVKFSSDTYSETFKMIKN